MKYHFGKAVLDTLKFVDIAAGGSKITADKCSKSPCTSHQWRRNESESGRAPVQRESGGGRAPIRRAHPHFFGSKSTISRFGERYRDCQ